MHGRYFPTKVPLHFCSAKRCLSKEFQDLLKSEHEGPEIEMVFVDESHTVESW